MPGLVGIVAQAGFGPDFGNVRLIKKVLESLLERQDPCVLTPSGCGRLFHRFRFGACRRRLGRGCLLFVLVFSYFFLSCFLFLLLFLFFGLFNRHRLPGFLPDHHSQPFRDLGDDRTDHLRHDHQLDDDTEEQAEEHGSELGAAEAPIALVIRRPGHDRLMGNRGKLPYDGIFTVAPLVPIIRLVNFIFQAVEFVEALVRLRLEMRLFIQNPADFIVEAGDATPQPLHMSGGILDLRRLSPEELTGFQLVQPIKEIAGLPQGVETHPVRRKGFKLCLYRADLTLERRKPSPGLLDLRVQRRQFLL